MTPFFPGKKKKKNLMKKVSKRYAVIAARLENRCNNNNSYIKVLKDRKMEIVILCPFITKRLF